MPSLQAIQSAISALPSGPPLVVVLAGGTTGIGAYIASALATTFASHGSKLRVYIVGRNASRAASVIVEGQALSPGSEWRFVKASDLALVGEVDRCCNEISKMEEREPFAGGPPRVDLLYCTYGFPILAERRSEYFSHSPHLSLHWLYFVKKAFTLITSLVAREMGSMQTRALTYPCSHPRRT